MNTSRRIGRGGDMTDYDAEIKEKSGRLEVLLNDMETTCQRFVDATMVWFPEWYEIETLRVLKSRQDESLKMSEEEMKDLRSEVRALVPDPLLLLKHESWPHRIRSMNPDDFYKAPIWRDFRLIGEGTGPQAYIRSRLNDLGPILKEHDLLNEENVAWDMGFGRPTYVTGIETSEEMRGSLEEYQREYEDMMSLIEAINSLTKEKGSNEIEERWRKLEG